MKDKFYYLHSRLSSLMCSHCRDAKKCHDNCDNCDEFLKRLEKEMNKPLEYHILKDIYGKSVFINDHVAVLIKCYGFRGIDRAFLTDAIYLGRGQYGYEFLLSTPRYNKRIIRIREPQCIKILKKGGK